MIMWHIGIERIKLEIYTISFLIFFGEKIQCVLLRDAIVISLNTLLEFNLYFKVNNDFI